MDSKLDSDFIRRLRQDFLGLMSRSKSLSSYIEIQRFSEDSKAFSVFLERLSKGVERLVHQSLRDKIMGDGWVPAYSDLLAKEVRSWKEKLAASFWSLSVSLSNPPFNSAESRLRDWGGLRDRPFVISEIESKWSKEFPSWERRVRDKSRALWSSLSDYVAHVGSYATVRIPVTRTERVEGARVVFSNVSPDHPQLQSFREGLALFRERSKITLPWLWGHLLPIVLDGWGDIDCGGEYLGKSIRVCLVSGDPRTYAHIVAHEMGHHLYAHLSSEAQNHWYHTVTGDYGDLDLRDLLAHWPKGKHLLSVVESLAPVDSILSLQADGLLWSMKWDTREDAEAYVAEHGPHIRVPSTPITGYATKNPEESFCEALGRLVAYGPKSVHPKVVSWFLGVVPNLRVASKP